MGEQAEEPCGFDPYEDRVARDIRNRLSTKFVRALEAAGVDSAPAPV